MINQEKIFVKLFFTFFRIRVEGGYFKGPLCGETNFRVYLRLRDSSINLRKLIRAVKADAT